MRGQRKTAKNFLSYQLAALDPHLSTSLHRYILISKEMGEKVIHCIKKQSSYLDPLGGWKNYYCKKCLKRVSGYFQFSNFSIGLEPPLYMICRGSIQQQARWPKNGLYNTLLSKMCQLRPRKVRGLDALVAAVSPGEDRKKRDIRRIRLEVFLKKWS